MIDETTWKEYLALLNKLGGVVEQLTGLEQQKTAAVSRGDLNAVDECMKREQVVSMTLRGIDQKRDKMLAKMGMGGVPLRRLEEFSPPGLELESRRCAEDLRRKYEVFQSASEVARDTLECNLRAIERLQQQAEEAPPSSVRQADFRA